MNHDLAIEIARVIKVLPEIDPKSKEYDAVLARVQSVIAIDKQLKSSVEPSTANKVMNNPALLSLIGNVVGIVMILNYERAGIITSRAFSFIRPK